MRTYGIQEFDVGYECRYDRTVDTYLELGYEKDDVMGSKCGFIFAQLQYQEFGIIVVNN